MNDNEKMQNEAFDNKENEEIKKETAESLPFEPVIEPVQPEYKLVRTPYTGGGEVTCPACGKKVTTRFCPYCGKDMSLCFVVKQMVPVETQIQNQAPVYIPNNAAETPVFNQPQAKAKKKKSHFTVALVFTLIGFAVVFAGMIIGLDAMYNKSHPKNSKPNDIVSPYDKKEQKNIGISEEEFKKLKEGLTYAQVSQIAGCDGTMIKKGENLNGDKYSVFIWPMEEDDSEIICITFVNDKASDIERNENY